MCLIVLLVLVVCGCVGGVCMVCVWWWVYVCVVVVVGTDRCKYCTFVSKTARFHPNPLTSNP